MKSSFKFLLVVNIILLLFDNQSFAQDPIDQYSGIPLVIYPARHTSDMIDTLNFSQMSEMGVYGVVAPDAINISHSQYLQHYKDFNLKVIPQQIWWAPNDIFRYTDAYYTVWEAEGTAPSKGMVTLYHSEHTSLSPDGKSIRAEGPNVPAGETIILGPGYPQVTEYKYDIDNIGTTIIYTAGFNMKIAQRGSLPQNYENDIVCTIEVTNNNDPLNPNTETTINSIDVKVKDFLPPLGNGWNIWKELNLEYNLSGNALSNRINQIIAGQDIALCVQFKVIWAGLDYLDLYVDNIRVHDQRGIDLMESTIPRTDITTQVQSQINDPAIIGWYGLDEPQSIDNYEPFRIVDSLINSESEGNIRLHTGFTGGNLGTFSDWNPIDTFALNNYRDLEFWLRAKPKNVQINMYNYNYPYASNPLHPAYNSLWQTKNIEYVTDYLDRINDFDTNFAFSTQSGKFGSAVSSESIIPLPSQINYHVNLGLMYGAKELRLDPFFSVASGGLVGLINMEEEKTENYYFFKNDLVPRLKSFFGKELKKIHQKIQHPNLQLPRTQPINSTYNWLTSITYLTGDGASEADFIDVGFFETHFESNDVPYFMVVNRWYNTALLGDLLKINIDKTGTGYTNYNVTNFMEDSKQTIVNSGYVTMPHISGEARLFKVYPVLKDGGSLVVSETTHPNDVLFGDMSIENGATLTVNGTYYAKANITLKSGGKIIAGPNGKIIFDPNKSITVEGNAEIKGFTNNRLSLEFSNSTAVGVEAQFGSNLSISNCNIKNAIVGIKVENGSTANISYVDFTNCSDNAVVMFGFGNGENAQTLATPTVYRCTIENSSTGISVVNCDQLVLKENTINHCNLGIFLNMVNSAYITSNTI